MMAKIVKGSSFGGCVRYVMGKKDAKLLAADGVLLESNTMFEEVKALLTKSAVAQAKPAPAPEPAPAFGPGDGEKIETLTVKLDTVSEKLSRPLKHHHTLDFMSNWVLIALAAVIVAFIVSLWVIDDQRRTIARSRDNDLKYWYIQMHGKATPADILRLRNIFEFNRNTDSIRTIRKQVELYEQLIQQQAENEARARLNDEQAKQLKQEAETVKGGR